MYHNHHHHHHHTWNRQAISDCVQTTLKAFKEIRSAPNVVQSADISQPVTTFCSAAMTTHQLPPPAPKFCTRDINTINVSEASFAVRATKNQNGNNDVTHTSNTRAGVSNIFGGQRAQPLLWAESRAARVKLTISGTHKRLNYCAVFYISSVLPLKFSPKCPKSMFGEGQTVWIWLRTIASSTPYTTRLSSVTAVDCITYVHPC